MAFLSYSHDDAEIAGWLHESLEEFHVPARLVGKLTDLGPIPKQLSPIFRDRHELAACADLGEEIREAISSSRFLIVLCSPDAAKSRWIDEEIATFKRLHGEDRILAAIISGEPFASEMPGREEEECFPPSLRVHFDSRGRLTSQHAEPVAADLRDEGDGKRMGLLKIAAGMMGVGLDELAQREAQRRHRRMYAITVACAAGMLFTSGLAYTAIDARDEARDQRREAEGLVAFMVGDLKDKLEPIGRLDALDGVGSRVLAYYSKQDTSELTDAALLQRAQALSLTAQVAFLRGNYEEAERLYREALAGTAEAVRRSPNDPQRLFDHAQNVFWVGDLARRRGQIDRAEAATREYKRLADRMVAIEPSNLKWQMEVLYAQENLGIVLMTQRRFVEATAEFEKALGPMESLAAADPANATYQTEVTNALAWLADAQRALGRFDDAIAARRRQVSYLNGLAASGTSDVAMQQQLIPAHQALGLLYTGRGQIERGIDEYRGALGQANRLMGVEASNNYWKDMAASVRFELAKNLLALGRRDEAAQEASAACGTAAVLRTRGPDVARWRVLQTSCLETRTRLAMATGANAEALILAERALSAARSERSGDPVMDKYRVAAAYRLLGDVNQRAGNVEQARAAWGAGFGQLPRGATERPWETNERVELLRRLGRAEEARPLSRQLATIGYRSVN
jgi:tetratricopeptide (TPR) repeat protein